MAKQQPASSSPSTAAPAFHEPPRRSFLYRFCTLVVGGIVGLVPLLTGLVVFFDPLRSRGKSTQAKTGNWIRVASIDAVPPDGIPRQFPVIADLVDAWNRVPSQPVGSVYLLRHADDGEVICLNAICPHAGCFVAVINGDEGHKQFRCPCHTSAFALDGEKIITPNVAHPSPRGMDPLEIDPVKLDKTGEIWIDFKNFYPGKHERKEKA